MPTRNKTLRQLCPLEAALEIIGGKWKGMIIYHLSQGEMRFNKLKTTIPTITHRMLIRQLRQLENDGIVIRDVQTEGNLKVEYRLSQNGLMLKPILFSLKAWRENVGAL